MEQQNICCARSSLVISDSLQLPSASGLQYPWLVSYDYECETDQIFFSSTKPPNEHYHSRIPELIGRKIRGCFYGWLILSKFSSPDLSPLEFCLWNPVTQEFINLPPLKLEDDDDDEDDILSCFLSSPPSYPDSVVLLTM